MSHFAVLVVTEFGTEEEIEKAMQPFHEYECTGIEDEYVIYVDVHDYIEEKYQSDTFNKLVDADGNLYDPWEDHFYREPTDEEKKHIGIGSIGTSNGIVYASRDWKDGLGYRAKVRYIPEGFTEKEIPVSELLTFEEFVKDYYGDSASIIDGRAHNYTNPNDKWDWWVIGGRWRNYLLTKDGSYADTSIKHNVDFEAMKSAGETKASIAYDRAMKTFGDYIDSHITWETVREDMFKDDIDKAREFYNNQICVKKMAEDRDAFDFFDLVENYKCSREDYIRRGGLQNISTFAVLDKDGKWIEKGEMLMFAAVKDEDASWLDNYESLLADIPDDHFVTIVDCHI